MYPLYLHIEQRIGVDDDTVLILDIFCQAYLVLFPDSIGAQMVVDLLLVSPDDMANRSRGNRYPFMLLKVA